MSKLLKQLNDNQNKVADTNGIMKLQAWDDGVAQDLTNKKITATVANASGFLFDIDLVSNGTEINLDFKDSQLQKLTPDTYFLEIKVTDKDGDVSVFPTEGYATFTINKNLHATESALVPQITFDTVLRSVDEKIAEYKRTIAKGDKGDKGDTGPASGTIILPDAGDLNGLTETGKYYQTKTVNVVNWKNRPANAPNLAFSVDVIGNVSQSLGTQVYYVHTTNRMWVRTIWLDGTITGSDWAELANDSSVVHKTSNEVIAGDKTFTGKVTATNIVETGTPQSVTTTTTFNGLTFSFTRIGNSVYVTTRATVVTTAIQVGGYNGIIPSGYRPIDNVELVFLQKPSNAGYVTGYPNGSGYFNSALAVGDKPRIVAYYPTTDPWPAN